MISKYFLLYADCKTIRELTYEEYREKVATSKSLVVDIGECGLAEFKGNNFVFVGKEQLLQVLAEAEWIKKELPCDNCRFIGTQNCSRRMDRSCFEPKKKEA